MTEEWRPVPGHEGWEASSFGRVRYTTSGTPYDRLGHRLAKAHASPTSIHRMVCMAFHGEPKIVALKNGTSRMQLVRHLNGEAGDNRPENLAWGDWSENACDRSLHGHNRPGVPWSAAQREKFMSGPHGGRKKASGPTKKMLEVRTAVQKSATVAAG